MYWAVDENVNRWSQKPNPVFPRSTGAVFTSSMSMVTSANVPTVNNENCLYSKCLLLSWSETNTPFFSLCMHKGKMMAFLWQGRGGCFPTLLSEECFFENTIGPMRGPTFYFAMRGQESSVPGMIYTYLQNELPPEVYRRLSRGEPIISEGDKWRLKYSFFLLLHYTNLNKILSGLCGYFWAPYMPINLVVLSLQWSVPSVFQTDQRHL